MSVTGERDRPPPVASRQFARFTNRILIQSPSPRLTSASIAIAIPTGAARKICCYGPWRRRARIERSLSRGAEHRRPPGMR